MIVINDSKENFMFQLEKITYECKKMINSSKEAEEFVERLKNDSEYCDRFMKLFNYDVQFSIENTKKMLNAISRIKFKSNNKNPFTIYSKSIIGININSEDSILNLLQNMKEAICILSQFDVKNENIFLLNAKKFSEGYLCENYEEIILFFQYYFPDIFKHIFIFPPNLSIFGLIYKNFLKSTMQKITIVNETFDFSSFPYKDIFNEFFFTNEDLLAKQFCNEEKLFDIVNNIQELNEDNSEDYIKMLMKFNSSNGNDRTLKIKSKQSNSSLFNKNRTYNAIKTKNTNNSIYTNNINITNNNLLIKSFNHLSISTNLNEHTILSERKQNSLYESNECSFSIIQSGKSNKYIVYDSSTTDKMCDDMCYLF